MKAPHSKELFETQLYQFHDFVHRWTEKFIAFRRKNPNSEVVKEYLKDYEVLMFIDSLLTNTCLDRDSIEGIKQTALIDINSLKRENEQLRKEIDQLNKINNF